MNCKSEWASKIENEEKQKIKISFFVLYLHFAKTKQSVYCFCIKSSGCSINYWTVFYLLLISFGFFLLTWAIDVVIV
jgi:hypothetical protein